MYVLVCCVQKVDQFQSLGTEAARLSDIPPFFGPKTLPIAPCALPAQFTVGVVGVSGLPSELSLFERLERAIRQRL
jgi:hypothetical protein